MTDINDTIEPVPTPPTPDTHATANTPPVAPAPGPDRSPSPFAPFWLYGVPILSLIVMLLFWNQTQRDIARIEGQQRQLAADLEAARGVTTVNLAGAPARGADDQVITLVEFSDYECPFCIRHFTQTMAEIDEKLIQTGRVRYVFKDFPIAQLHPGAARAHEAARCAAEQGKFWEMHTRMFSAPGTHSDEALTTNASVIGLAAAPFAECLSSGRTKADVEKSIAMASELGATGTPTFFVGLRDPATNDVKILTGVSGAQPFEVFEQAIATVEARVKATP